VFLKKKFSQVLLHDDETLEEIAESLGDLKKESVLEIGAGTGLLTKKLCENARKVTALEIDEELKPELEKNLRGFNNVEIIFCDARDYELNEKIVFGNLPYHLSSELLFKVLKSGFQKAVLCLQKEFGERLTAGAGEKNYSRLSVMAQNACEPKILFTVDREKFSPVPKTDSVVVLLERKKKRFKLNPNLVNALFQHKNQSVKNALKHSAKFFGKTKQEMTAAAGGLRELAGKKVRDLTLQELEEISETLY
jgi:16S rRNA (adenine1518-N6/adenine1519-N6)-dimethyltransferase